MKKILLSAFALTVGFTSLSQAGTEAKSFKQTKEVVPMEDCRFRDTEWQVDVFYSAFFGGVLPSDRDTYFKTGSGGGFGVNFFFARYFGVGYEAQWYSNNGTAEHLPLGFNGFLRFPICKWNIAPYSMIGVGAAWDGKGVAYGNVGGGLEYRATKNLGLFVDSRYFYGGTGNVTNFRAGVRWAF